MEVGIHPCPLGQTPLSPVRKISPQRKESRSGEGGKEIFLPMLAGSEGRQRDISAHTDKKENQIFLTYKEILSVAVAKSYMRKGLLINGEMHKYFPIYEEAVSYI